MTEGRHEFTKGVPASAPRTLVLGAAGQLALQGGGLALAAQPLGALGQGVAYLSYGAISALVLSGLGGHAPHRRFGLANAITLARAAATALLLGVAGDAALAGLGLDAGLRWLLAWVAAACLASDGLDGWLARRRGSASAFGARFDMETDALLILALAMLVREAGQAGSFVLLSGALRYLFLAASWPLPALRRELPRSLRRKTVCVVQTALLVAALAPALSSAEGGAAAAAGLVLLIYSFAVDVAGLLSGGRRSNIMRPRS